MTYHMNRLQSLRADREFCVTLNRTAAIDPEKIIRTMQYAHPVYTPAGVAAQARHHEISGRNRTHYCGAYWGWGFHEDGVSSALRVVRELGAQRSAAGGHMTASAIYEGTIRHRRFAVRSHEFSHRLALMYLDLEELDGLLDGRLIAGRPGLVRFRRADYLGDPSIALADAVRTLVERADGQGAHGPDPSAHAAAHVRALLQPGQLLLLLHTPRAARRGRGGGDQHAMGGASRLRARASRRGTGAGRQLREGAARVPVHGDGAALPLARRRARRDARRSTSRATSSGRRRLRRDARAAPLRR